MSQNSSSTIITGEHWHLQKRNVNLILFSISRNGLIAKQHRLNSLLGIKEQEIEITPVTSGVLNEIAEEDRVEDFYETQEEHIESVDQESLVKPDVGSELDYQEIKSEMEMFEEDEQIEEDNEQVIESYEDEEMETTIDQLEENFQLDENSEDFVCYVDSREENIEDDEDYVEYGGEISMIETPQATKRKYTKNSKDSSRPYKCWIENCGATFAFRTTMKKHMNVQHSLECQKPTCCFCGNKYEDYAEFLAHVKGHTRKAQCDVCKLTFVNEEKMENHKTRVHNADDEGRNFQCNVSLLSQT